jgi:uncharacterized membrane protein
MKKFISFLKSIKLFDPDNTLSLTNLAMMVVIGKLAFANELDWTVLTAFFLTLASYNTKKVLRQKEQSKSISDQDKLTQLETALNAVKTTLALKR